MKSSGYGRCLSMVYDILNGDVNYEDWADFYTKCFDTYSGCAVKSICEMACGTGSLSVELKKRGYNITAFDLSEDMLTYADKKAQDCGLTDIRFTLQDMRNFKVYNKVQAVICMMDGINCLQDTTAVAEAFSSAYEALDDGGLFIFDVNSKYKFENIYSDNAYILEDKGVLLAWQNFYNKGTKKCDLFLTFFVENDDGSYERIDEHMKQKMHTVRSLDKALAEAGFVVEAKVSGFGFENADENSNERIFYICKKMTKKAID